MKTIIAKRDKNAFWFILILSLVSWLISGKNIINFLNSDWRWFGIFYIVTLSIITLLPLFFIIFMPNATVIKQDENIIIYQGVFKKIIPLNSILFAELEPLQKKQKESKNGTIILKIKTENGEENISIGQVKDKVNAISQINNLLSK